jgi:hypothetical protein
MMMKRSMMMKKKVKTITVMKTMKMMMTMMLQLEPKEVKAMETMVLHQKGRSENSEINQSSLGIK